MYVNWIYCANHVAKYAYIKSLHCMPKLMQGCMSIIAQLKKHSFNIKRDGP